MLPEYIKQHTAEVAELLKDASYKRLMPQVGFDPYVADDKRIPLVPGAPFTFAWAFAWTKPLEDNRAAWEQLIQGFKLALGVTHPTARVAHAPLTVEGPRIFPLAAAQMYAKFRRTIEGPIIFIEVDVVCNRPCNPFEGLDFDIGLTDCEGQWPMMPFNPGVMFANDTPGAQRFLDTAMEYACNFPQNGDPWYLYQMGLSHAYLALKDQVKIQIFPHEMYNYAPDQPEPTDAYFVHLKGDRKRFQRDFVVPLLDKAGVK